MKDIFDLYDLLIQSMDIRDYFKQMWRMNALELEKLIIHANAPLTDKLSYLVWVRDTVAYGKDKNILTDTINLYEQAVNDIFKTNRANLKFKATNICLYSDEDDSELENYFIICNEKWRKFDSFLEMINKLSENKPAYSYENPIPYYRVEQYIQKSDGILERQISYIITWIKGKLSVIDFSIDDNRLKTLGIRAAVFYRKYDALNDIPLPFNNDEVSISTPMMKQPIYGKAVKTLDDQEKYVYLFYPSEDKFKDCPPLELSYQKLDMTSYFTTFDCVVFNKVLNT